MVPQNNVKYYLCAYYNVICYIVSQFNKETNIIVLIYVCSCKSKERNMYLKCTSNNIICPRRVFFFVRLRLTHPISGIGPGGRMRCAISSMSSVSATLDSRPR